MDTHGLVNKLQIEVGITREEAEKSVSVIKEYIEKENKHTFYDEIKSKARDVYDTIGERVEEYSEKIADKMNAQPTERKCTPDKTNSHILGNKQNSDL